MKERITITIDKGIWKKLSEIKLDRDLKTFDDVLDDLLESDKNTREVSERMNMQDIDKDVSKLTESIEKDISSTLDLDVDEQEEATDVVEEEEKDEDVEEPIEDKIEDVKEETLN